MEAVSHRFEELSIRLNQPETAADPALFRRLMQEYHEAEPVVQAYQALTTAQDHLAQAKALLEGETEAAQKGLGIADEHDGVWMPGVLSRKKQVAAPIMAAC